MEFDITQFANENDLKEYLDQKNIEDLRLIARSSGLIPRNRKRADLIVGILDIYSGRAIAEVRVKAGRPLKEDVATDLQKAKRAIDDDADASFPRTGIVEINEDNGYGFVRTRNYSTTTGQDYYISASLIEKMRLVSGDKVKVRLHHYPDRTAPTVSFVEEINDQPAPITKYCNFDTAVAKYPTQRLNLNLGRLEYSLRATDLLVPIGKGQRGLLVAPPKAGKTSLLKKLAIAIKKNHPEVYLVVLLIDERPEEVTDFMDSVGCDVAYSTFDQQPANHCRIAELVFANARRRVEQGQDVVILLDSITRLARAYNQLATQSGRTLTGGLDITALQKPKKLFGMGRKVDEKASLTVLATALVDTGSKMDDIIYEEFKSTGNSEIVLDRRLSEKRIFPAIDLYKSSTRHDDLLLTPSQVEAMYLTRKLLNERNLAEATEQVLEVIMATENNDETVDTLIRLAKSEEKKRLMRSK